MYRAILQGAWDLDTPGRIPSDEETLINLADCPDSETWERHGKKVIAMFELSECGTFYTNERQTQELDNWRLIRKDYARRGRMGGNAKKAKTLEVKQKPSSATNISSSATNHASNQASTSTKPVPVPSQSKNNTICAEASSAPEVIKIPLNDSSEHPVTEPQVVEWKKLYPAVDVIQELRKMRGWSMANTEKRKTKRGINKFINLWLSKAQDQGGKSPIDEKGGSNGTGTSKADKRSADIRDSTGRVRDAALRAIGDDPGSVSQQALGNGAAALDVDALARGGKVLDARDTRGDDAHDQKSATVSG